MLETYLAYGQWANRLMFEGLARVPHPVLVAPQKVVFGSILQTAHHALAMSEVWRAHLTSGAHPYTSRIPDTCPSLAEIAARQSEIDFWYRAYALALDRDCLSESVPFTFIDGGEGAMRRDQILLHVVNHATYHRGHIVAMLNASGYSLPSSDLPVFLSVTDREND